MDVTLRFVLGQQEHPAPKLPDQVGTQASPATGSSEGSDGGAARSVPQGSETGPQPFNPMFLVLLVMGVFFVFMMGGQRKEKKKRAKLLASIKKGDRVQTMGGMLGAVVELRDTEIVLKVDENANTRIKFSRSAIQSVVSERPEDS